MTGLKSFFERCAFHLPLFHDWLAERDDLRRKTRALASETEQLTSQIKQLEAVIARVDALWMPPGHFYSPIPSIAELKDAGDSVFRDASTIPGIDLNVKGQLELLEHFKTWYAEQPFTEEKVSGRRYYFENPNYSNADGLVLYSMMRYLQPRQIVEVGSGHSSCAMIDVNELFFGNSIDFTFIDPYPERLLLDIITESDRQRLRIIGKRVQEVDLQVFRAMKAGDILFIDSSHVSKTGSDVNHLLFNVLPILEDGVFIHFHDIFHSFEYPVEWVLEGRAWNESYILRAFLTHNKSFQIRFFTSYLMHFYRDRFAADFPLMLDCPGGGIWLSKGTTCPTA